MKKSRFKLFFLMVAAMALPMTFASCSSSDDDDDMGNIETPKYEAEAAKYEISTSGAAYKSIELTASGNYIIVPNSSSSSARASVATESTKKAATFLLNPDIKKRTRSGEWGSGILYGTYTKTGEGEYTLNGLGKLKITSNGGSTSSLDLTLNDGTKKSFSGAKQTVQSTSDLTNFICRTWNIAHLRVYGKKNGKTVMDIEADNFAELNRKYIEFQKKYYPDEEPDSFEENPPKQVVITKSNTYMVLYEDNELAVANWKWVNEKEGKFMYSWDEEGEYDDDYGYAYLKASGSNLIASEEDTEYDEEEGVTYTYGFVYTLSEAK